MKPFWIFLLFCSSFFCSELYSPVSAQQPPLPNAPTSGGTITSSHSYVVDALICAVFVGGAIFAVCRSSQRN